MVGRSDRTKGIDFISTLGQGLWVFPQEMYISVNGNVRIYVEEIQAPGDILK